MASDHTYPNFRPFANVSILFVSPFIGSLLRSIFIRRFHFHFLFLYAVFPLCSESFPVHTLHVIQLIPCVCSLSHIPVRYFTVSLLHYSDSLLLITHTMEIY